MQPKYLGMSYYTHKLKYGPWFKWKRHLFDIHLYSLKAVENFHNSKLCKLLYRLGLYTFNYNSPIGLYVWLSSSKDFSQKDLKHRSSNLEHLAKICELHLYQRAKGFGTRTGKFIGILATHEDYYYILMDEYGNKWYETCCGKLEFLKD